MDHVIREIDKSQAANYTGATAIARNEVKLRFWPISIAFPGVTNPEESWYSVEEISWDEIQLKLEQLQNVVRKSPRECLARPRLGSSIYWVKAQIEWLRARLDFRCWILRNWLRHPMI
jgi:hypothetical protein